MGCGPIADRVSNFHAVQGFKGICRSFAGNYMKTLDSASKLHATKWVAAESNG
jgi:hypothetical protein